jgi:predicted O-methyltransferase YrrM
MEPIKYLVDKFSLDLNQPSPIEIPNVGREILGTIFKDLGYRVGAEIGVFKGEFANVILRTNPEIEYYCIDAWEDYNEWRNKMNSDGLNLFMLEAQERLKSYNVHFMKMFSMAAIRKFKDESLDFVYIDANHDVPWVMDDIVEWSKKVRPGGIVAGHDYIHAIKGKVAYCYVRKAVSWYTQLKPVPNWFLLGRDAKITGEIRDTCRSFFWIKE